MMKKAKQWKTDFTTEDDLREVNFAIGQVARKVHQAKQKYRIPKSLKEEILLMRRILRDPSIDLSMPFAHIVPRKEHSRKQPTHAKKLTAVGVWT